MGCFAVSLALGASSHAFHAPLSGDAKEGETVSQPTPSAKRVYIFVSRLDSDQVVAEDGRVFKFSQQTIVTGRKQSHGHKRIAELVFEGNRLVHVHLR